MLKLLLSLHILCFIGLTLSYVDQRYHLGSYFRYVGFDGGIQIAPKRDIPEIKVYYQCMCPHCRSFDSKYFLDVVKSLSDFVDINTYPYGKAQTIYFYNGTIGFECPNGPIECYGNKLHACALNIIENPKKALIFNGCLLEDQRPNNGSNDASVDECGQQLNIDVDPIKACAKDFRGDQLLQYYGEETRKVTFKNLPHVLLNGVQWEGRLPNFFSDVCESFNNPPSVCGVYGRG